MPRGRNAAWRTPTPQQRELLRVVFLADFPNRDAIAAHLDDIRVQPGFARSSGVFDLRLPERLVLEPQDWPVELSGQGTSGIGALIFLFAGDGRDFELEIAPLEDGDFGTLDPKSIRDYDRIVDGPDAETWVARDLSLIEEQPSPPN